MSLNADLTVINWMIIHILFILTTTALLFLLIDKIIRTRSLQACKIEIILFLLLFIDLVEISLAYYTLINPVNSLPAVNSEIGVPLPLHLILILLTITWLFIGTIQEHKIYSTTITPNSIREAMDNLPSGLCFFRENGLQILTNRKMEYLAYILTGKTLMNGQQFWQELSALSPSSYKTDLGELTYQIPDGSVWRFTCTQIIVSGQQCYQMVASDITRFYRLYQELLQENSDLVAYYERLQKLLEGIAETQKAEEILASKTRIHDKLGQCLLTTRRFLDSAKPRGEIPTVLANWQEVVQFMEISWRELDRPGNYAMQELLDVAAILGIFIIFSGGTLEEVSHFPLLKNAIREAMANAVQHAGATILKVQMTIQEDSLFAVLTDNGPKRAITVDEGNGLSALRERIERAGGRMEIRSQQGVELRFIIPRKGGVL